MCCSFFSLSLCGCLFVCGLFVRLSLTVSVFFSELQANQESDHTEKVFIGQKATLVSTSKLKFLTLTLLPTPRIRPRQKIQTHYFITRLIVRRGFTTAFVGNGAERNRHRTGCCNIILHYLQPTSQKSRSQ